MGSSTRCGPPMTIMAGLPPLCSAFSPTSSKTSPPPPPPPRDHRTPLGVGVGDRVRPQWPARPLLTRRGGWNAPGDEGRSAAMMGNHHSDAGERLGDIVLISEQPIGKGKVVVFGDTSGFTNNI